MLLLLFLHAYLMRTLLLTPRRLLRCCRDYFSILRRFAAIAAAAITLFLFRWPAAISLRHCHYLRDAMPLFR